MVRHSMEIIDQVHKKLKLDHFLVLTADQPVYAIGKQVQCLYTDEYCDHKVLLMIGPLHIKMNFLNLLGNWLESSGWTESLVETKITSPGKAESFLSGSHPKSSKYAHQVTRPSLSLLMNKAYQQSHSKNDQNSWMSKKKRLSPQFLYWCKVMELETLLLSLIKSLQTFSFPMFIGCLEQISPWMSTIDHTNYACWLPVFIHDLKSLQSNHPGVYKELCQGKLRSTKVESYFPVWV